MSVKFLIYFFVSILVIWSIESININGIFKKNRVFKAQVFYFLVVLCMTYLLTNFIMDLFTSYNFF